MWYPTLQGLNALLRAIGGGGSGSFFALGSCSIGLIAAPFTPAANLPISALTEANFTGYARQAVATPGPGFIGPNNEFLTECAALQWSPSDTATTNLIYGQFLVQADDSINPKATEAYNTPINLSGPLNRLTVVPRFGPTIGSSFGDSLVSN